MDVVINVRLSMTDDERKRLNRAHSERNRRLSEAGRPTLRTQDALIRAALDEFCAQVEAEAFCADVNGQLRGEVGPLPPGPEAAPEALATHLADSDSPGGYAGGSAAARAYLAAAPTMDEYLRAARQGRSARPQAKVLPLTFGKVKRFDDWSKDRFCNVYRDGYEIGMLLTQKGAWEPSVSLQELWGPIPQGIRRVRDAQRALASLYRTAEVGRMLDAAGAR